jgi:hypothetical protein
MHLLDLLHGSCLEVKEARQAIDVATTGPGTNNTVEQFVARISPFEP